ncbi:MAG: hypothetical protein ACR5K7_02165 [Symbiopectobacterium sp.]
MHIGGYNASCSGGAGIIIKDFCGLSQGIKIYSKSDDHPGKKLTNPTISKKYTGVIKGTVALKKHVTIASGTVVLPNITLETLEESVYVGAQFLITKNLFDCGILHALQFVSTVPVKRSSQVGFSLLGVLSAAAT